MRDDILGDCLALLMGTFRAEVDTWQARGYRSALKGIPLPIVAEGAKRLVDEAAAGRKFYPMPTAPEWKEACAKIIETKRREAFQMGVSGCEHPSFLEEYQDDKGVWWTRRCACYERGKQLMAAAGEPLALPSYTEPEREP